MADLKLKYVYNTFTLDGTILNFNSLTTATYSSPSSTIGSLDLESSCIDYLAEVNVNVTGISSSGVYVKLFAITTLDATNFSDSQSGNSPSVLKEIGILSLDGSGPWRSAVMSVAAAFNGVLPPYFKLLVLNSSGKTLSASGNSVRVVGVKYQYV